jgi:hypothetical protein
MTQKLFANLKSQLPGIKFVPGQTFYWSPKDQTVFYNDNRLGSVNGQLALLHESAHALLKHTEYTSDFELVMMEVAAWEEAKQLAVKYKIEIDDEHIQDCLDTYRDWLHQRSTCPRCGVNCLQETTKLYRCHNCNNVWEVSTSRFCRPYRRSVVSN